MATAGTSSATCTCCCPDVPPRRTRLPAGWLPLDSVNSAMSGPQITLLVTLTGRDRPGVTSRLFTVAVRA